MLYVDPPWAHSLILRSPSNLGAPGLRLERSLQLLLDQWVQQAQKYLARIYTPAGHVLLRRMGVSTYSLGRIQLC